MIKIAVISDIHANKDAFLNVLNDINEFNPDKIFCLGDLILAGYDPNFVVQKIIELKEEMKENFEIIQGNTDKMVAYCDDELIQKTIESYPCMGYSLQDDVKITDKKYIDFVKNLPENKYVEVNGLKIELVHGSPRRQNENIYPDLTDSTVSEMVQDSLAELILCGHTHIPCGYSLNCSKTVINVGSVGRSMTKDRNAVYLRLMVDDEGSFSSEHRIIKYDNQKVINHILSRGLNRGEDLAKMYIA